MNWKITALLVAIIILVAAVLAFGTRTVTIRVDLPPTRPGGASAARPG